MVPVMISIAAVWPAAWRQIGCLQMSLTPNNVTAKRRLALLMVCSHTQLTPTHTQLTHRAVAHTHTLLLHTQLTCTAIKHSTHSSNTFDKWTYNEQHTHWLFYLVISHIKPDHLCIYIYILLFPALDVNYKKLALFTVSIHTNQTDTMTLIRSLVPARAIHDF